MRKGPHFEVAAVANRWQRVGDLIAQDVNLKPFAPEADVLLLASYSR